MLVDMGITELVPIEQDVTARNVATSETLETFRA